MGMIRYRDRAVRGMPMLGAMLGGLLLAACSGGTQKADAYEALADTLNGNRAYPAAIEALNKAVKYDSNEPRRWLKLGRTWRALRNPSLSAVSYQRALDLDPANVEALQNLSVMLVSAGRFDDAKQYIGPLLALSPNDPGGLLASGALAFFEKRYGDADKLAAQIIEIAPGMNDGYVLRSRIWEALGRRGEAAQLLESRLALDSSNQDLATQLLALYRRMGDIAGIRRTSLILAKLEPDNVVYQLEAARAHQAAGRVAEAQALMSSIAARYTGSPGVQLSVAQYWIATLPRDAAVARIVAMAEVVHGRVRARLADTLVALGKPRAALQLLASEAKGPVNLNNVDIQAQYARALLSDGQLAAADAKATEVMAFDVNEVAMLVQAQIAFRRGKYVDALNSAQVVFAGDRQSEEAALLIAQIYDAQHNPVMARKAYGDAQSKMPASLRVASAYAEYLARNGQPDDAVTILRQFARANDNQSAAKDHIANLCARVKTDACKDTGGSGVLF